MKIVSKFKDYYDAGLVYWIDEKLYFKREQKESKKNQIFEWDIVELANKETKYCIVIFPLVIGFCWEFYPLYRIHIEKCIRKNTAVQEIFVYTYDDFVQSFINIWCERVEVKHKSYHYWTSFTKRSWEDAFVYKGKQVSLELGAVYDFLNNISNYYDTRWMKKDYTEFKDIFAEKSIAYFIVGAYDFEIIEQSYYTHVYWLNHMVTHPILKDYKFSQIKDAFTAFQEISMFLWNMNHPDEAMLKPDDKYVAYSKWFCSHSFKKQPTKSKQKPCNKKMSLE